MEVKVSLFGRRERRVAEKKPKKHVFAAGDKVCFHLSDPKTRLPVWHMGVLSVMLPKRYETEKQRVSVIPYEIAEPHLVPRAVEEWETDAAPMTDLPNESLILGWLLRPGAWPTRSLPPVEVELSQVCLARHEIFLAQFVSREEDLFRALLYR